ncbi:MAG: hypothetical protein AAGN82_23585 [Myxococcota bacterium]
MHPLADDTEALEDIAADAARSKRRAKVVLFGVIPTVVVGAVGAATYYGGQAAQGALATTWDEASACLVGPPLLEGEAASVRMRAIQLRAIHDERDRKGDQRWPSRCADEVAAFHQALRSHGSQSGEADDGTLARRAEAFAVSIRKANVMDDLSDEVDGFFAAAAQQGLVARPATLELPTPEPSPALRLDTLPPGSRISPHQFTLDGVTATPMVGNEIHVMVYDKKVDPTPIVCTFRPDGRDACQPLEGALKGKSGLRLAGTVDVGARPLVLAGKRGDGGVFRSEGDRITAMSVQSAWSARSGVVALAGYPTDRDDGRFDLVVQSKPGAEPKKKVISPADFGADAAVIYRKQILWGHLLVQVLFERDDERRPRLMAARIPDDGEALPFELVADVDWVNADMFGCQVDDALAVVVGRRRGFISFLEGDGWSTPVRMSEVGGAFSCHAGEAVFVNAFGGQQRCTPAGCTYVDGVAPSWEPFSARDVYWAELAGRVLAVAQTERRGGLRYRFSAGKNLGVEGADRTVFDDLVRGGSVTSNSTVLDMKLVGRGTFAVLLLTTPEGVYALRFGREGSPTPATIARG